MTTLNTLLKWSAVCLGTISLQAMAASADPQAIQRGEYLARAGDCMACHTVKGGEPYAGGLGLETPIGAVYATNITPDPVHGIGAYTLEDFDKAVRHGIRRDGSSLYPAMPFPSYAKVSDQDIADLYAYFMNGVKPAATPNRDADIPWPLSMRWPLTIWRWTFAPAVASTLPASSDPQLARGQYLIEGLGHCGSCHTPRGIGMQEKALSADAQGHFLSGGAPLEGWVAKNLRGDAQDGLGAWSEAEIAEFLKTGRTDRTAVFGSMTDVVQHSMQYLTDDDRLAIARYLKSLPASGAAPAASGSSDTAKQMASLNVQAVGARTYADNCMACHRSDGKGYAQVFPALAGNSVVNGKDATSLVHIVLDGGYLPGNQHAPTAFAMPGFAWRLSDQEVADVVTFIRTGWGNTGKPVTAAAVQAQRSTNQ
ncbi:c-type cytochrome [Pseudomonas sp. NPDC088444]|uniref:c-type cytochrome n=1 Tax=Pseudomonas sp. NPDC088444 TaxID=3364456 RepID=UPI00384B20CA